MTSAAMLQNLGLMIQNLGAIMILNLRNMVVIMA